MTPRAPRFDGRVVLVTGASCGQGEAEAGTSTRPNGGAPAALTEPMLSLLPVARSGDPGELAELVAFLASDAAAYIKGAEISIDGGWTSGVQATEGRRFR